MHNPVKAAITHGKPFIYFHTHVVNHEVLDVALVSGASLELDIAVAEDGSHYIGHPREFYDFKGIPQPQNLPLDYVLDRVYHAGLFLAIDCKNVRALPKIKAIIERFGPHRCQFHAWADELLFKPYPVEIEHEPHWKHEDIPTEEIIRLRQETSVAVVMAVRGLTQKRLEENEDEIVSKIIRVARGHADSIYFYLPNGDVPPMRVMNKLLDNGLLTYFNVDVVPKSKRPPVYHGMTDRIGLATSF